MWIRDLRLQRNKNKLKLQNKIKESLSGSFRGNKSLLFKAPDEGTFMRYKKLTVNINGKFYDIYDDNKTIQVVDIKQSVLKDRMIVIFKARFDYETTNNISKMGGLNERLSLILSECETESELFDKLEKYISLDLSFRNDKL